MDSEAWIQGRGSPANPDVKEDRHGADGKGSDCSFCEPDADREDAFLLWRVAPSRCCED